MPDEGTVSQGHMGRHMGSKRRNERIKKQELLGIRIQMMAIIIKFQEGKN